MMLLYMSWEAKLLLNQSGPPSFRMLTLTPAGFVVLYDVVPPHTQQGISYLSPQCPQLPDRDKQRKPKRRHKLEVMAVSSL